MTTSGLSSTSEGRIMVVQFRSSHRRCSIEKGIPKNCVKFKGKHICQSLFFNKVAGLRIFVCTTKRLKNSFTIFISSLLKSFLRILFTWLSPTFLRLLISCSSGLIFVCREGLSFERLVSSSELGVIVSVMSFM